MNIVTLIDDPMNMQTARLILNKYGHTVEHAVDEDDAEGYLSGGFCEALVIGLEDSQDIMQIVRSLRRKGVAQVIGVVDDWRVLDGVEPADLVAAGVDLVATDYAANGGWGLFIAQVEHLNRRLAGLASDIVECGDLRFDMTHQQLTINGQRVPLSPKEWKLVERLVLGVDRTVMHEHLLDHLYGTSDGADYNILAVMVCKIRRRIKQAGGDPRHIQSVLSVGYLLSKTVQETERSDQVGVSLMEFLLENPGSRRSEVCEGIGIEPDQFGSISYYLKKKGFLACDMERKGWVGRWSLTDEGFEELHRIGREKEEMAA